MEILWLFCMLFNFLILGKMTKKGIIVDSLSIAFCYAISIIIAPLMLICLLIIALYIWLID